MSTVLLLLVVASLIQIGCATIINGQEQNVSIKTDPPGATATILPEGTTVSTPADVDLARGSVHTVKLELPGYRTEYVYLDRVASNMIGWNLLLGGLIGMGIDYSNDSIYRLTPDPIETTLEPAAAESAVESRP